MQTHIIEVTNEEWNWGKFLLMRFDSEWQYESTIDRGRKLLRSIGWNPKQVWVLDLQTGEGAAFLPGDYAHADLEKHKVWVCPMFQPFLTWLYKQDLTDLTKLPAMLNFKQDEAPPAMFGYRRPGPETADDQKKAG